MQFSQNTETYKILQWAKTQIDATRNVARLGWDISIVPHQKSRTGAQNRFLMAICANIVRFYHDTGYLPPDCGAWAMDTETQKKYWKNRLGVVSTRKLSTADFGRFLDQIQATMAAESGGEYEILTPPDEYAELINH